MGAHPIKRPASGTPAAKPIGFQERQHQHDLTVPSAVPSHFSTAQGTARTVTEVSAISLYDSDEDRGVFTVDGAMADQALTAARTTAEVAYPYSAAQLVP
jgi:hypothetical protein